MCALNLKYRHPFIDGLKKHPEGKKKEMQKIKSWMVTQPHLPEVNEEFIYLFLHACYYSHEKTKNAIEAWFTIRATHPTIFSNRDPMEPKMRNLIDMGTITETNICEKALLQNFDSNLSETVIVPQKINF